jgi:hypothetical protein
VASIDNKWGVIDTNATLLFPPIAQRIDWDHGLDGCFFFQDSTQHQKYGIAEVSTGQVIVPPVLDWFDWDGFENNALRCQIDGKLTYLNRQGQVVWQDTSTSKVKLEAKNITNPERFHFEAPTVSFATDAKVGFSIQIAPLPDTSFHDRYQREYFIGHRVLMANCTSDTLYCRAVDGQLYIAMQALDRNGTWRDINTLPEIRCLQSKQVRQLRPHEAWHMSLPAYEGAMSSKIRLKFTCLDPTDRSTPIYDRKTITIYSNEVEAYVNPTQFIP